MPEQNEAHEVLAQAGTGRLERGGADVGQSRERSRMRRLTILLLILLIPALWLGIRLLMGDPVLLTSLGLPDIDPLVVTPILFFLVLTFALVGTSFISGRSPHVTYRPEQISTTLDDVVGIESVKEEVERSLNLFLAHRTFSEEMGGTPRRGLLFEGAPGTGKTHLAKAMAREAGVPFLFVSATSFQSMYYGATARKIRAYFKALRKAARREGGAIGFIEEIDAIATVRGGMSMTGSPMTAHQTITGCGGMEGLPTVYSQAASMVINRSMVSEGVGGVVNELLVQMQSFDDPSGMQRMRSWFTDKINLFLPAHRQIQRPVPPSTNILLIAATNRADSLDPALLRPGRFDRRLTFELPGRTGRRALFDHFLAGKAHDAELDGDVVRDGLAAVTQGYSPVMIEHLLDEALVNAVRRGSTTMNRRDVEGARLVEEVGLGQPVQYTDHEQRLIATHEAGHATVAWLLAPQRRLEVLSIIKRRDALGMLAHGDRDEVYTRSKSEMIALIRIAMGGQVAEEIFFNDISTGPGGDLLYATNVAAQMVGACGMDDTLISYAAVQSSAFSDQNIVGRVLSDSTGREQVERMLQAQRDYVRLLLGANQHLVAALRDALVERHELIGMEITDVLEAAGPVQPMEPAADAVIDLRSESSTLAGI
ncbi:MAG: AAA family ATPase [Actinobacteria bacterium]|nr:AAA family ATPase [Actinomycetota bacterium]